MILTIFSLLNLIVIVALIILVVKTVKSTAGKVILTIVLLIGGLIVQIVGTSIIGVMYLGETAKEAIKEQKDKDKNAINSRIPINIANNEKKDFFQKNEIVRGNGVEIKLINTNLIKDNKDLEYIEDKTLCGVEFTLKNIHTEKQSISAFDFEMQKKDGERIYYTTPLDKDLKEYSFTSLDLDPEKEITKKLAFDCKSIPQPVYFVYKGGESLTLSLFVEGEDRKFVPVKFELSY